MCGDIGIWSKLWLSDLRAVFDDERRAIEAYNHAKTPLRSAGWDGFLGGCALGFSLPDKVQSAIIDRDASRTLREGTGVGGDDEDAVALVARYWSAGPRHLVVGTWAGEARALKARSDARTAQYGS